ncbi:MFS transporter [Rathayibacter sp. VKM Ac-2760]|uniref:MFS transporter n=1 Tax=Rathayibacter sp. VKM Ac-2760 TaxID=2609253 RepID=UPI0013199698|nr:MFS transporter [Rathayibacter sp. VKM Ac-2760]QHC61076.1 MFS transporter [Rathayibacter sp. VKM Ac-2760]
MESNEAITVEKPSRADRAAEKAEKLKDRVPFKKVIPWSTHSFTMNALIVLTGYFTIYATDTLALNPAVVGGLLVLAKVIDAIGALLAGYLIDRAPDTRFGKARPFDLLIIACWATTAFMFSVPGDAGDVVKYVWLFSSYTLLTALFMPLYNANSPLYTARVFPKREHYSDLAAKSGLVTVVVAIFITIGVPLAVQAAGKDPGMWALVALALAVPFTIIGLIRFWAFRESPDAAEIATERLRMSDILLVLRTNPYIWVISLIALLVGIYAGLGAGAYYFRYIVGNLGLQGIVAISFVALLPLMVFFPVLIRKFSVSRMIAVSSFIGAGGFLVMMVAGGNIALIMVSSVLTALASLPFNFLAPVLIIDNSTYNEYKGHRRLESVGGALFSFAGTVGAALSAGVLGIVLTVAGYDGSAETQSAAALDGIIALNSWIPAIFAVLVGLVALYYHRLEKEMKVISAEVVARRATAKEGTIAGDVPLSPAAATTISGTEAVRVVREESGSPFGRRRRRGK